MWVPKYRYRVLIGEVRERLKEILRELCEWQEITIIEGAIKEDHVHMYLSVPPKHSPSHVMKILKGKSAEYLAREFPELAKRYWGMHMWAQGILCKYSRNKRRNNTGIYKKAAGRRRKRRPKAIVERQQRMTLSGVVVS